MNSIFVYKVKYKGRWGYKSMYKIGDFIIYGNNGVCKVVDIGKINISGISKNNNYYNLSPINENGNIFVPVDTSVFMRNISTYEEVQKVIELIPLIKKTEYNEKNVRLLQTHYTKLLQSHECIDLLTILAITDNKKSMLKKNGKKLGQIDDKFMKIARGLIDDEFSVVLGIDREDVEAYIKEKIESL